MRGAIMGELTIRGRDWFVSVSPADGLRRDSVVLVCGGPVAQVAELARLPSGPGAIEALLRLEHLQWPPRPAREVWTFTCVMTRPLGSAEYDREAQRKRFELELSRLWRSLPQVVHGNFMPRRRRRQAYA